MDITQLLLVIVVTVLTVLLVVIGVQVVYILKEMRKSLEKVNAMLDDANTVTGGISRTFNGATGLIEGIKTGLSLVNIFGKHKDEA
jgi:hypothetical protein